MRIHATAVVEPGARIAPTATVGPFCVLGADVVIGRDVRICSHATISGAVLIEEGACIGQGAVVQGPAIINSAVSVFPYAVIGQVGQFPDHHSTSGTVEIGTKAVIREFVVINKSVTAEATRIGAGCYLMARTQIDHDCVLEPFVKTATGVTLGGSVHIEDHAYLGMNAVVHQGLRIGRACMIGMNGVVTAHVPPFTTLVDRRISRINVVGLARIGASEAEIASVEAYYRAQEEGAPSSKGHDPWIDAIKSFIDRVAPAPTARFAETA